jgi:hypothetical protein
MAQRMLQYRPMSRTALALVMVAASASTALAGGFVGLGIGTGAASSGGDGDLHVDEDGRSGRLMVGYRFGRISIEGMGTRYDMYNSTEVREYSGTTLALAGKYSLPLQDHFEVFGRLGIQRTSLNDKNYPTDWAGTGFLVGGGAELKLPVAAVGLSLFVDYNVHRTSLTTEAYGDRTFPVTSRIWTLGATLSF